MPYPTLDATLTVTDRDGIEYHIRVRGVGPYAASVVSALGMSDDYITQSALDAFQNADIEGVEIDVTITRLT